jgi:hypothetical protein
MFQILRLVLVALTMGLYATPSSAQIFKLNLALSCAPGPACTAIENAIAPEIANVEADINKGLPGGSPDRFMEGMANSSVMAGKGIGSDYSSYMDVFLVGAGVGVGADMEKSKDPESDLSGIGIAPGVVVGLNLGVLPVNKIFGLEAGRLNVYANFMSFSKDQEFDKSSAGIDMTAIGAHVRYDWIRPRGNKLLGWGGVKIHTGYEYNKTDLTFASKIDESITVAAGGGAGNVSTNIVGTPEATIKVATHSIPLEVSTDVRFLYFLSMYTGLGVDFNFGQAKGDGALNAGSSAVCSDAGGAGDCGAAGTQVGTVSPEANIDATGKVNSLLTRGFVGVQFNIPLVRVFVQADKAFGNDLVGATAGLRIAY